LFTLFAIMFFFIGLALFGIGLLGEYVGRIYTQVRDRPRYVVEAVLEDLGREEPVQNGPLHEAVERRAPLRQQIEGQEPAQPNIAPETPSHPDTVQPLPQSGAGARQ
jgi:hypothetical protein